MRFEEVKRAFRSRSKRRALWVVFLLVTVAYLVYPTIIWWKTKPRLSLGSLGTDLLLEGISAGVFYFMFIWLSPVAWQWDGRSGIAPPPSKRLFIGFFAAEVLVTVHVGIDHGLNLLFHRDGMQWEAYLMNFCFQGPALFLVGSLLASRERLELEREELRQRSDAVMAEHLKGQVHPHVLFNTLNGLAELMQQDHQAAEELVEAMSGFLHRVLDASQQGAWPLSEERNLTEDYLKMEGTRLGSRLQLECAWDPKLEGHSVLPLMLQPLVENAIKHGISHSESGGVLAIAAREEGDRIVLEVRNTVSLEPRTPSTRRGLGLPNLRRRLELAYGGQASFAFDADREGWTVTRISLPTAAVPRQ